MNDSPLEEVEQRNFVDWLRIKNLKFSSIPNSTFTKSWSQKRKNREQGLNAGLPDLVIVISKVQSNLDKALLVFIEMKRKKGGIVSGEQKCWIEALNEVENVGAYVAKGFDEAKAIIEGLIK